MSQLETKTERIGGVEYTVGMLPARRATKLLARIGRIIGPALGIVVDRAGGIRALLELDVKEAVFGPALQAFFQHADPDAVDAVLMELAEVTLADGKRLQPIYDVHFAGRQGDLLRWARFALQVQFADFFGAMASAGVPGLLAADPGQATT